MIMNQYNQVPHLIQDTTWESDKNTIKHHKQEPIFNNTNDPKNKYQALFPMKTQKDTAVVIGCLHFKWLLRFDKDARLLITLFVCEACNAVL